MIRLLAITVARKPGDEFKVDGTNLVLQHPIGCWPSKMGWSCVEGCPVAELGKVSLGFFQYWEGRA